MTLLEPLDTPPTPPLNDRPPLPRTRSTPWAKTPSMESLSSIQKNRASNVLTPTLKKRHSTYVLSNSQVQGRTTTAVAVPASAPQRPLRNPARGGARLPDISTKPKPPSRPSTATKTREEITPWEFEPSPGTGQLVAISSKAASSSGGGSPLSSRTRTSLTTGPVVEVTPWELYPVRTGASRSSITTGTVEEVTPWELYNAPLTQTVRSSLATGLVEEVTPWELYPTPKYDESPISTTSLTYSRSSPRVSTSSNQGKTLSDLANIRRRKSTGAKAMKTRSNTLPTSSTSKPLTASNPVSADTSFGIPQNQIDPTSKSAPTTPKLVHKAAIQPPTLTLPAATVQQPNPLRSSLKFSTADRTILEELKRNISARAAQFTLKGISNTTRSVGSCQGKKHHPYPPTEVPYPRSYDRDVLDLDVWETTFCQDICESLTWHVFETPPTKVLDIGCGTGTWILNCARVWKDCQFVGLDVVPLHPDLQQVGSPDLASRITWFQENFLQGLPFPNEEFDFVHIKRVALGVPEDKWDRLFEEIVRVMKPGGAFEMLEEDLFFPGQLIDNDSDTELETDFDLVSAQRLSQQDLASLDRNVKPDQGSTTATSSKSSDKVHEGLLANPSTSTTTSSGTASHPDSPATEVSHFDEETSEEARELLAQVDVDYSTYPVAGHPQKAEDPVSHPPTQVETRPQLHIKTPLSIVPHPQSRLTGSAMSLFMSSMGSMAPPDLSMDPTVENTPLPRPRGYSLTASPLPLTTISQHARPAPSPVETVADTPPSPASKIPPFLLRTVAKPPINPRDHSLLETIYTEMLGSRFINVSPLALLANYLGLYFKDVRTHPPLQYAFPPARRNTSHSRSGKRASLSETGSFSDSDDARDAILPSPVPRLAHKHRNSHRFSSRSVESEEAPSISEDNRYLDVRDLIHHSSPYITLDDSRIAAFSPSTKTSFTVNRFKHGKSQRGSRLPNTTMNLDLRSLNLHLALRTAEVLACSESMWEWVLDYQAVARKNARKSGRPSRSGSFEISAPILSSARSSSDSVRNSLVELTRDEFDSLLTKFDMDMRDHFSLGDALEDRLSWSAVSSSPSTERKIFENSCDKWDKWEAEQQSSQNPRRLSKSHMAVIPLQGHNGSPYKSEFKDSSDDRLDQEHNGTSTFSNGRSRGDLEGRRTSASSGTTLLPPTRRLSRAMRVFVAWKA